jgi:hypothetical protein
MTNKDMIAILKAGGMTERDLQRCCDVADIDKVVEITKRREESYNTAVRAVKKRTSHPKFKPRRLT